MKTWLSEHWFKVGLLVTLVASIGGSFYWYELRPNQIKQECNEVATRAAEDLLKEKVELGSWEYKGAAERDLYLKDDYKSYYEMCQNKRGL